ncbi:MAG: hypothetical protein ACOYNY_31360 [Caldilineaceae bacterium]
MIKSPQIEPVTSFIKALFFSPSGADRPIEAWDRVARRMRELELLVEAKRSKERNALTVSHDELKRLMLEKRQQAHYPLC